MNKLFILAAFATIGLASCKKDYTCRCTSNGSESTETITDTKNDARAKCDEGDGTVGGYTRECELD